MQNKKNLKLNTITNITNYSTINDLNKSFFPSLTHKELLSINDLKLKMNNNTRAKLNKNFYRNFHSEVMKTNLKENSKYSSLYKDSTYFTTKTETKFPSLTKDKKEPLVKLYMNPTKISSIINKSINKNIKINYKTIFNSNNNISKKYNISNLSTTGNISPSMNSNKLSALDKIKSNSVDFNGSLLNLEKEENSLRNNSSIKYTKTDTLNNNSIDIHKELNKKFVTSLNPFYTSLKKELLSEFYKKTKDMNYLNFILMKNKKDIEIQKERRISDIERIDQILFSIQTLKKLFDKYCSTKNEYLNYLQKEISNENEKNEILKEEKITLMKEIYTIRHKTLRLENRFKNYLDDKYFLLSVKNHSFKLDKFVPEDRADYTKDLQKLEVLNLMLKITSKEYSTEEIEERRRTTIRLNLINRAPSRQNTLRNYQRNNNKRKSSRRNNDATNGPLFSVSKKRVFTRNSVIKPIYTDVYYFNKDLQETTQKIQDSLDVYNNIIKELNIEKQYLDNTKKEMKDIREYEMHLKEEIILYRKNLDNLKKLNNGLFNYKKYLENIFILNLNKGKVLEKINNIINNIEQSNDNILLNFLINKFRDYNTYLIFGIDKLKLIEVALEYLFAYKTLKKKEKNKCYYLIQKKVDDINRIKLSKKKQELIKERFDLLIKKVVDKNKKIIVLQRKKVNKDMRIYLKKNRTENCDNEDNNGDYFGNFDVL